MKQLTLVFPIAHNNQEFGKRFKPFLKFFDKTFIELAIEPFTKFSRNIKEVIFIVKEKHFSEYNVAEKIVSLQLPFAYRFIPVDDCCDNVIQSINKIFLQKNIYEDIIICDSDHTANLDSFLQLILNGDTDCMVPVWNIKKHEINKWSLISLDEKGQVRLVEEKKWNDKYREKYGIIGYYYFKKLRKPNQNFKYVSEIINSYIGKKNIGISKIKEADFFGDPERLHDLYVSKKSSTIFCDIDGTISRHENIPDYKKGIELLPGAIEKLNEWRDNNTFLILTTSRDEQYKKEMEITLRENNIKYDYLVMGLPPGPRYLINDKKPYSDIQMAKSFEVERDKGIKTIGHSFASLDIRNNTIEKSIPKDAGENQQKKFANQFNSMNDMKQIPNLEKFIPRVFDFDGFKFNIEFLEEYKGIHEFDTNVRNQILPYIFKGLHNMYFQEYQHNEMSETAKWDTWFTTFIEKKIYGKKKDFTKYNLDSTVINRLKTYIDNNYHKIRPRMFVKYFHGDCTYENILFNNFDVKFIDLDNDYDWGPVELDMGKLTQSIYTRYESWDNSNNAIKETENELLQVMDFYGSITDKNHLRSRAYFYCILHLIRMIPYQAQRDINRCKIAISWVNKLLSNLETISD